MSVAEIMAAAASCTAVNTMYSGVVEEVTRAEQVQIKIRQETYASMATQALKRNVICGAKRGLNTGLPGLLSIFMDNPSDLLRGRTSHC